MVVVRLSIATMGTVVAGGSVAAGVVVEVGGAVVEGMAAVVLAAEVMVAVLIPDIGPDISTIFVGIATTMQDVVVERRWARLRFPAVARMRCRPVGWHPRAREREVSAQGRAGEVESISS